MAHPFKIANGLLLDYTLVTAGGSDVFLLADATGNVTSLSSIPSSRISGGGNVTEATSSVLTITGGTSAVLNAGLSIQVKQSTTGQSGYLSSTDWNTFNSKLSTSLTSANVFVGNGSNVATGVSLTGAIAITNAGVTSINVNYITDSMVNSSAAIAVSKFAAMSASLVAATDGSGFLTTVSGFTTTIAGYLTTITSNVQNQLNTKLTVTLTSPASGDVITYNGSAWVNSATGSGTLPVGGTANQYLSKIDGTNYNTQWTTLTASKITDLTATASEINVLHTVTTTTAQLNYLNTTTSDVQTQLNLKLNSALTQNYLFVGNASNVAVPFATGTDTYVLTSVGGVPTWVAPGVGGTVTSVAFSTGTTGLSVSGSPVTTSGTITLSGTLVAANGGTSFSTYATGDIIYASASNTLSKLAATTNGFVLTLAAGVPSWAAISGISGLTATRIPFATSSTTLADDSLLTWNNTTKTLTTAGLLVTANSVFLSKAVFAQTSINAPLNLGGYTSDPSSPIEGDISYNTTSHLLKFYNGTSWLTSGITNSAANNEIMKSDGANATTSGIFSPSAGDLNLGTGVSGTLRTITGDGSGANVGLSLTAKGTGVVNIASAGGVTISGFNYSTAAGTAPTNSISGNPISGTASIGGQVNIQGGNTTATSASTAGKVVISSGNGLGTNSSSGHVFITTGQKTGSGTEGSLSIFDTTGSFGAGEKVIFIHNATTDPTTNPTGGGILYTSGGALKYRGSSGTVTTIANA